MSGQFVRENNSFVEYLFVPLKVLICLAGDSWKVILLLKAVMQDREDAYFLPEFLWQSAFSFFRKGKELMYSDALCILDALKAFSHFVVKRNMWVRYFS